jgi:Fe-S oxidoreductase
MFDLDVEKRRFAETCTACGQCVAVCPIIPFTELKNEEPEKVMESVLELYRHGKIDNRSRTRLYSCMGCRTCKPHCPEDLDPGLGLCLAAGILRGRGEALPKGLSFLLPETEFNLMKAVEAFQIRPEERPWVTDPMRQKPAPSRTVVFTGCTGIMQPDVVSTLLEMIRRFDPTVKALGGVDYCCGDTNLRAGNSRAARDHFSRLLEGLGAFSPETVVFLCPTCKMYFDLFRPTTSWSGHFVTPFLADHLGELGPFGELRAKVTLHDACHLVRGERPESDSPRRLLRAIPGIEILEMQPNREDALCCGATAMAAIGAPGVSLRAKRLRQAQDSGAQIMALYCPACQSIFGSEVPKVPFEIRSIITLLGRSLGIVRQDKLSRYLQYRDPQRVLKEAEACIEASELPAENLRHFASRYFRG